MDTAKCVNEVFALTHKSARPPMHAGDPTYARNGASQDAVSMDNADTDAKNVPLGCSFNAVNRPPMHVNDSTYA